MRLPNGYGSVYKLSGKNRRKPWTARVTTGWNDDGYPIYRFIGYYEKRTDAIEALAQYNKTPYDISLQSATIEDVFEIYKSRKYEKLSTSSRNVYNSAFKRILSIHKAKIKDLKTYQLQTVIDSINLSWQSKAHTIILIGGLFNIAMELDICDKNYAKFINLGPKPHSGIHKPFSQEEIKMLFENVFMHKYADTVLIMCYTGMRPCEMLGMKSEKIDLENRYMIGGLKTQAGKNRIIPIHTKILPLVKRRMQDSNTHLVENNGNPISYTAYSNYFSEIMQGLSMNHLPGDGRHTFASMMDTAGANKVATKKILGHATQDITEKIYTHKNVDELLLNIELI